jgi:signal transduction histidine kinase
MVGMADPKTRPLATDSRSGGTFGSRRIAETRVAAAPEPAKAGPMQAHWLDDHLLLMRRARLEGRQVAQAAVVDWPLLRSQLIAEVQDILPGAGLVPATAADALELRLAALPVRLDPGTPAATELRPAARWTLAAAWLGTAIGMAGAALLLTLAHRLGERRATFVSAVTHELRTPLTSMRLHADLLADQRIANDPHKRAGRIAVLRSEAGRLAHLIDNVLDYARLERRKPPAPKRVVLSELIEPLLPRLSERLAAAGLALECQPLPAATVSCDQAAVERILANLADNAAKYAAQAEDPSVVLRVLIADRRLELRLRDHGPGLAPDVRERLFVPFARSAEAAAGNAPGVGLGLALCRRLARAQGGDLRLDEPADGSGVEVVLTLPLAG